MGVGENASSMMSFTVSRMDPSDILNLASEFVVQYYTVMRKYPSGLHRFYKDDSAMIHENETVFGQQLIHDKIMSMDLKSSRVGILRLDALRANGNSVLIQVSGEISFAAGDFRRFMQSFILCEQAPCDFYVLNDIFRYQDHVYGDVKADSQKEIGHFEPECVAPLPTEDNNRLSSHMEPESITWDNVTSEAAYKKIEPMSDSRDRDSIDEVKEREVMNEPHTVIQSPVSQPVVSDLPEENLISPPTPPQPRTWAQMASKQPAHGVLNMQASRFVKPSTQGSVSQAFDEPAKSTRQSSIGAASAAQRPRGVGGRGSHATNGRVASGDHGYQLDNRQPGQVPMRSGSGRIGPNWSHGSRGGRGWNAPVGGRGTGAAFARRGQ